MRGICLALPETTLRSDAWGHAFQIRRGIFTMLMAPENADGEPDTSRLGVVLTDDTDWEELGELITESYRILAPKKLVKLLDEASP